MAKESWAQMIGSEVMLVEKTGSLESPVVFGRSMIMVVKLLGSSWIVSMMLMFCVACGPPGLPMPTRFCSTAVRLSLSPSTISEYPIIVVVSKPNANQL